MDGGLNLITSSAFNQSLILAKRYVTELNSPLDNIIYSHYTFSCLVRIGKKGETGFVELNTLLNSDDDIDLKTKWTVARLPLS